MKRYERAGNWNQRSLLQSTDGEKARKLVQEYSQTDNFQLAASTLQNGIFILFWLRSK